MTPLGPSGAADIDVHDDFPRWGLGDVALGIVAAQLLSAIGVVLLYSAAGWSSGDDVPIWASGVLQIPLWAGLAGVVVWAARTKGHGVRADFGLWMRWTDAPLGILIGVGIQLLLLPLVYLPVLSLLGKDADDLSKPARELSDRADGSFGWIVLAVMVVICAPVVEELFYRGLVLRSLDKRGLATWVSVLCSAALFAAVHFQPLQFVGLLVLGLVLAAMTERQQRLGLAIWTHAAFNATTVVTLYLSR